MDVYLDGNIYFLVVVFWFEVVFLESIMLLFEVGGFVSVWVCFFFDGQLLWVYQFDLLGDFFFSINYNIMVDVEGWVYVLVNFN